MRRCPKCQFENLDIAIFCASCGQSLIEDKPNAPTYKIDKESVEKSVLLLAAVTDSGTGTFTNRILSLEVNGLPYPRTFDFEDYDHLLLGRVGSATGWSASPFIDLMGYQGYALGVSRQHLRIQKTGDQLEVVDLGSSNGSYLHSKRLNPYQVYPIHHHDELLLGQLKVKIIFSEK
jgi:hypothetical protein